MPEETTTDPAPAAAAPLPALAALPASAPKAENHLHYLIREGVHVLRNELDRIGPMAKADYLKLLAEVHKLIDMVDPKAAPAPEAAPAPAPTLVLPLVETDPTLQQQAGLLARAP